MPSSLPAPVPTRTPWQSLRLLLHLPKVGRLCWRLLRDGRVGVLPKALLVASLVYVVVPFDLVPDWLLFFGELDDLAIVLLATHYFLAWSPTAVVEEHARAVGLRQVPSFR